MDEQTANSFHKRSQRLRIIGFVILMLGVAGALTFYWIRTRSLESNNPSLDQYESAVSRAESRQMGIYYGKMGSSMQTISEDLKRPGVQAVFIAGVSIVIATIFFKAAQPFRGGDNQP